MISDLIIKRFITSKENTDEKELRKKYGTLSGTIGILLNLVLCALKFVSGMLVSSISIIADAFNNLSDAGSSIVTLVGFKMAGKPADKKHPFGYGRVEYVSGLIVSIVIVLMGLELIKSSIDAIITGDSASFDVFSTAILVVSMIIKLWMCVFNRRLGNDINSVALKTLAMDSLSDVIATATVLIGIAVTYFTGVNVDGYSGIIVALFIIYTGISSARDTLNPLLGQKPDKALVDNIKNEVLKSKEIMGVHDILVHNYGPMCSLVSLHVEVPSSMSIVNLHSIIDKTEQQIKKKYGCDVVIHMDPVLVDDKLIYDISEKMWDFLKKKHERITVEDFRLIKDEGKINLIFDICIPEDYEDSNDILKKEITDYINGINETYGSIINIKRVGSSA